MIKENWLLCPACNGKTRVKLREDTVLENFPLFCPKCKQETVVRKTTEYLHQIRARRLGAELLRRRAGNS